MVELSGQTWAVWRELESLGCRWESQKHLHPKWDTVVFVVTIERRGVPLVSASGTSERRALLAALIEAVQVLPVSEARALSHWPMPHGPHGSHLPA